MRSCARVVAALVGVFLLADGATAAKDLRIKLRFTPKENVTANIPSADLIAAQPIQVEPLKDERSVKDLSIVGENRERREPRAVRATSPVADFATHVLRKCLSDWGVHVGPGGVVLQGEIANLMVTEDQTYSTAISIRFRLEDSSGRILWQGVGSGDAHQWGRSFEEENYNEEISDALKRTYANLIGTPGFQAAWTGKAGAAEASAVTADELKAKVLEMMKAGVGTDTIASYVGGAKLSNRLTADQIIDWKKAQIPDPIINAAVSVR